MKMRMVFQRLGVIAVLGVLAGCSASVPEGWTDVLPNENLDKVIMGEPEDFAGFYTGDIGALRTTLRSRIAATNLAHTFHCEFDDGRVADGFLRSPNSVQYTLLPEEDGRVMVMATRGSNTRDFADLPDETACHYVD